MQDKAIELHMEYCLEADVSVALTEVDCHRVLMNVAENAVKFSPSYAAVFCRLALQDGWVVVTIQDQGHGIPDSQLERVVERFYRLDHVRGREPQDGHGLGLAIVKETLDRDGGTLVLQNHEKGGLVVQMTMPIFKP